MKRVLPVVLLLVASVVGLWLWRGRGGAHEAAPKTAGSASVAKPATVPSAYQSPAHVAVTVTDATGPLAGALVRLAGEGDVVIAATGADGVARADVAAGAWKVSVSASEHEPAAIPSRTFAAGETARLAVKLETGGRTLSGTITDATGGPIAGARVDAAHLGGLAKPSEAVASATTSADGKYKLTVAEGQTLVAVSHTEYAAQSRYVDIGPAGATADFALVPGGVIEGVVRDEKTKEPVAGAHVSAARDQPAMLLGDTAQRHVTAGADGHFRITGLRPGSYELDASLGARYARSPTVVGIGVAENVTDVVILVAAGATIRGTVVDDENAPVADVRVSTFGGDRGFETDEKSDARGHFVLEGLPAGAYNLIGTSDTYIARNPTRVELGAKDVDGVVVHVRRGGKVHGHVEPRQVCDVRLDYAENTLGGMLPIHATPVTTGPDGEFQLGPVNPIPYVLVARCPSGDQGTKQLTITPDLPEQIVEVTAGASIAGRVVDGAGKPVATATVMASSIGASEHTTIVNGVITSGAQALTAGDGTFTIKGLAAGAYRMRVLDRGRPIPVKKGDQRYTLADKQHLTGVELAIERADGVIQGTVTTADGKPIADAWVSVTQTLDDMLAGMHGPPEDARESKWITVDTQGDEGEAPTIAPVLTDSNGHFVVPGLPRVAWTVIAEAQAGRVRGRAAAVTPDATITIQAQTVTELHGTVHVAGTPPSSFSVALEGPTRSERMFAWTDGTFAFGRVDPGTYTVRVTSSAGNAEQQVTVAASTNVDITLASNAIITGRIIDAQGKPVAGIPVAVVPDQGPDKLQVELTAPPPTSESDGSFRVETKAGKVVVIAMTPPKPTVKRGVVAEAGKTVDIGNLVVDAKPPN